MFARVSLLVLISILFSFGDRPVVAQTVASLQFQSPEEDKLPVDRVGTDTRGSLRFTPVVKSAPGNRSAGGTRGALRFTPAVKSTPGNRRTAGTRGFLDLLGNATNVNGDSEILSQFLAPDGDPSTLLPGTTTVEELLRDGEIDGAVTEAQDNRGAVIDPELAIAASDTTPLELIPLMLEGSLGRTVSGHPTFYVYVPPTTSEAVFFSVQTSDQRTHYQAIAPIEVTGGILAVTLPNTAPELALDQDYQWFFALIEPDGILRPDNYGVQGWVRRVATPADLEGTEDFFAQASQYAAAGIWYDMLHSLALYRQETNQSEMAVGEWRDLLNQVGLGAIAEQPLLNYSD
ncbi:MAG: DUF928 domain-containing protein [Limnothrix sp. RL_2_0]|nr:DUF928 domain-containing protein [Limnothrix sp. RL_2_0]